MDAFLAENIQESNCKRSVQVQEAFKSYEKRVNYLTHSVHDTNILQEIFVKKRICLKGNSQHKDFTGLPLIWFGVLVENEESTKSRFGSFTLRIKIKKGF